MESDDSDIGDMLDDLLANAEPTETENIEPKKGLKELNFNFLDSQANVESNRTDKSKDAEGASLVHDADLDSSDDEDKRNFEEQKYSDCGRELKNLLKRDSASSNASAASKAKQSPGSAGSSRGSQESGLATTKKVVVSSPFATHADNVYRDPVFGMKLVKPLISSMELVERMTGRMPVTVSQVRSHIATERTRQDWVIAGVVINRSTTKTSQKGSQYCIWKLSDLSESMNTVSVFLFNGAYKLFWKTTTGAVVGILNPSVMESRDDVDQATLSVDNAQKLMLFGYSRDMAKCKSTKKNGEPCSNIVNLSRCEYCVYHVKQEYNKASRRADIQSNASGRGPFSSSQPKNKAPPAGIYAQGGPNFTPVFAKKNHKMCEKDSARLALLRGGGSPSSNNSAISPTIVKTEEPKKKACSVELTTNQTKKDLERLNKLRGWNVGKQTSYVTVVEPSTTKNSTIDDKSKKSNNEIPKPISSPKLTIPRLGAGIKGGSIDFTQPITKKHVNTVRMNSARLNAARWVKDNCVNLKPSNPNKIRESRDKIKDACAKRQRESDDADAENERLAKKSSNGVDDKFKEMMEAKSAHVDLIEKSLDDEQEKYFGKLEMKERMEEKMMTTFKVDCKAVKCILCRYTSFSASELCKQQKHPLRVVDATKSFFRCADCGNRTVSLDRIPSLSCNKCGGSHWARAAMMDEKKIDIAPVKLSIRGGEETFIGSVIKDGNLNLLVPDSGTGDS